MCSNKMVILLHAISWMRSSTNYTDWWSFVGTEVFFVTACTWDQISIPLRLYARALGTRSSSSRVITRLSLIPGLRMHGVLITFSCMRFIVWYREMSHEDYLTTNGAERSWLDMPLWPVLRQYSSIQLERVGERAWNLMMAGSRPRF